MVKLADALDSKSSGVSPHVGSTPTSGTILLRCATFVHSFAEILEMNATNEYIVYILRSKRDEKRYYIGFTKDVGKRLKEHNAERAGYSARYAPWRIETLIIFKNYRLAKDFEQYLKSGSGNAFLKKRLL